MIREPRVRGGARRGEHRVRVRPHLPRRAGARRLRPPLLRRDRARAVELAVARLDGKAYATSNYCTHLDCLLSSGKLQDDGIRCSCHNSVFDLETGEPIQPPATEPIRTYPVREEDGEVLVGLSAARRHGGRPAPAQAAVDVTRAGGVAGVLGPVRTSTLATGGDGQQQLAGGQPGRRPGARRGRDRGRRRAGDGRDVVAGAARPVRDRRRLLRRRPRAGRPGVDGQRQRLRARRRVGRGLPGARACRPCRSPDRRRWPPRGPSPRWPPCTRCGGTRELADLWAPAAAAARAACRARRRTAATSPSTPTRWPATTTSRGG